MSKRRRRRAVPADVSRDASVSSGGVDPQVYFSGDESGGRSRSSRADRTDRRRPERALQVSRQAREQLALVFAGDLRDPALTGVTVGGVRSRGATLAVDVWLPPDHGTAPGLVLERLQAAQGLLRSAVARAIHRKRTPRLTFRVLGYEGSDVDSPLDDGAEP